LTEINGHICSGCERLQWDVVRPNADKRRWSVFANFMRTSFLDNNSCLRGFGALRCPQICVVQNSEHSKIGDTHKIEGGI